MASSWVRNWITHGSFVVAGRGVILVLAGVELEAILGQLIFQCDNEGIGFASGDTVAPVVRQ